MQRTVLNFPKLQLFAACLVTVGIFAMDAAKAQNMLSETCLEASGPPDALHFACTQALDLPGTSAISKATILVRRAQLRAEMGRGNDALKDVDAALKANPFSASAYRLRGLLRHHQGDTAGALADFADAVRLNPHEAAPHGHQAAVLLQLGRPAESSVAALHALSIEPGNPLALLTLGARSFAERDFAAAAKRFHAVLEGPRLNYPLAAFWYAAAVARDGGDGKAAFAPYRWWWQVGGWPQALSDIYAGRGQMADAGKISAEQNPAGRAQALFFLSQWQFVHSEPNVAFETLTKATEKSPPHLMEVIVAKYLSKRLSN